MQVARPNDPADTYGRFFGARWKTVSDAEFNRVLERNDAVVIDETRVRSFGTIYHRIPAPERACRS